MVWVYPVGIIDVITLFLTLFAIALILRIIIRFEGEVHTSYKYLLVGVIVFGVNEIFKFLDAFQILSTPQLLRSIIDLTFIVLIMLCIYTMRRVITEIDHNHDKHLRKRKK